MVNFLFFLVLCGQKCGMVEEQIDLLKQKLRMIYQGEAFNGKATKTARSHGKKFQVSIQQETARILVSTSRNFFFLTKNYLHCLICKHNFNRFNSKRYINYRLLGPSLPLSNFNIQTTLILRKNVHICCKTN